MYVGTNVLEQTLLQLSLLRSEPGEVSDTMLGEQHILIPLRDIVEDLLEGRRIGGHGELRVKVVDRIIFLS